MNHPLNGVTARPVLLAHSERDARRWRTAYPDRWAAVAYATGGRNAGRGYVPASVDVTPAAAETRDAGSVLDRLTRSVSGEVAVNFLPAEPANTGADDATEGASPR